MCKNFYRLVFCVIFLSVNISIARTIMISGVITDTILETGPSIDPVLKIIPVEACSVSVVAACLEIIGDHYFAKTDKNGRYSLLVTFPDACGSSYDRVDMTGYKNNKIIIPRITIRVDSLHDTLKKDLSAQHELPNDSGQTEGYKFKFSVKTNPVIHGGDTINFKCSLFGTSDNPYTDTLHFTDCQFKMLLLTSSGDTVHNEDLICSESGSVIYLAKTYTTDLNFKLRIPENLEETYPDFAKDRELTLVFSVNRYYITYKTSFQVIDTDIPLDNLTGTRNPVKSFNNSTAAMSVKSNKLHVTLQLPGIYSIGLFALDGRLQLTIAQNRYFQAGEHVYDIGNSAVGSSKLLIAKLKGAKTTVTTLVRKY